MLIFVILDEIYIQLIEYIKKSSFSLFLKTNISKKIMVALKFENSLIFCSKNQMEYYQLDIIQTLNVYETINAFFFL